ncbi:signal peptidase I [Macrococcus hajekii]|uniref:Signal peptidase I n=1 Tax=Macrococcus hajekii TaxID=198482 RepID=A0A4R6BNL9_9STAP|nr:signal peptidase I [Macrococcus hajekii]TDM03456.1 signal peptidase I [Macrococcus hajekii]GGA99032.1 signal peptidase I [Macrococcus hajekii]
MKKEIYEWLVAIIVAFALYFIIHQFLFVVYTVNGDSMHPTLKNGEKVIVSKINYTLGDIHKGDVVVFHADSKDDYVKRVIGTAGDKVRYQDDQLYVNDKKVDEPYLEENKLSKTNVQLTENFTVKDISTPSVDVIPEGKLLVLGDNREVSKDSRYFGLIDEDQVVGEVSLRFWPFNVFHYNFDPAQ